jgi:hypothetical protein
MLILSIQLGLLSLIAALGGTHAPERLFVSVLLGLLSLCWIVSNAMVLAWWLLRGRRESLVPFLGGISGCFALLICPVPGAARWAWLPPLLDIGCLPLILRLGFAIWAGKLKPPRRWDD